MLRRIWMVMLVLMLAGCGFHLRGGGQASLGFAALRVVDATVATQIAPVLRQKLQARGVALAEDAGMELLIHAETYSRRVLSVDSQGRAAEYGLSYVAQYSLRDEQGRLWLSNQGAASNRDLRYDPTAVLASDSEEARLKREMINDAVTNILNRLQRAKPPQDQPGGQ
jgi:LPS-assembly lipoprotein